MHCESFGSTNRGQVGLFSPIQRNNYSDILSTKIQLIPCITVVTDKKVV